MEKVYIAKIWIAFVSGNQRCPTRGWNRLDLRLGGNDDVFFDGGLCIMKAVLHSRPSGSAVGRWTSDVESALR